MVFLILHSTNNLSPYFHKSSVFICAGRYSNPERFTFAMLFSIKQNLQKRNERKEYDS